MQRSNRIRQHHIFRVQPALAWGRNLKSPLRGTCRRHSVPYSRTENCSWVPPSREKHSRSGLTLRRSDAQRPGCLPLSWPHAERTRSPWTPAPHLPAPGTRARPQLCSQQPAVSVAARPFPATWSCSALGRRGADSRAYLRGAAASGRPRDGVASAQRAGRSRSRPVLLIGGRSLPARSAGSALMGAGRPELGLGRRLRGLGSPGRHGVPAVRPGAATDLERGPREVPALSWRRGWWPRLECSASAGRAIPGLRRLRPAPRCLPAPRSPRPRATPLCRAPPRRRTGPRTCLLRRGLRAHHPAGSCGTEHSNLA